MAAPIVDKRFAQKLYNVTMKIGRRIDYIVIHYTATGASALNNVKYFSGGNRNASADYFVDKDGSIYLFNAEIQNYYTWHSGDGKGKYGISNSNSIGIEVVSSGSEFTAAQKKALRELVPWLMEKYGVKRENVVRHYDASRKLCPLAYSGTSEKNAKWKELRSFITKGEWSDMATKEEIAQAVWGADISGVKAGERLHQCNKADSDTSDPTGRGSKLNNHDHIKWIAKVLSDLTAKVDELNAKVDALSEK